LDGGNINILLKQKATMQLPKEKELSQFSKKQHEVYKKNAFFEGLLALIPGVIFIAIATLSSGASGESFSPSRFNLVKTLFPFLLVAYFLFLGYVVYDIHEKLRRK